MKYRCAGSLSVKVMYITGDDEMPYSAVQAQIPYEYTLEIPGITREDMSNVQVKLVNTELLEQEELVLLYSPFHRY